MAVQVIKQNYEEYEDSNNGASLNELHLIIGANTEFEARQSLPQVGTPHNDFPSLRLRNYNIEYEQDSSGANNGEQRVWRATLNYNSIADYARPTNDGDFVLGPSQIGVNLRVATISQRVYNDLNGNPIGLQEVFGAVGSNQENQVATDENGKTILNPDADTGADILVPSVELEIEFPSNVTLSASKYAAMRSCIGRVNATSVSLRGSGLVFDKFSLLCIGVRAQWRQDLLAGPQGFGYNLSAAFVAGRIDIADGLATTIASGSTTPDDLGKIPMRYGYWTKWRSVNDNIETVKIIPAQLVIFEAYKTANFNSAFSEAFN